MLQLLKATIMKIRKLSRGTGMLIIALSPLLLLSCGSKRELPVVKEVDLEKYSGKWYDITHLPQRFQAGCKCVTAEYTPGEKYVRVLNTCVEEENDEVRTVSGKAFPVKGSNNARLKVQFFWPFKGDYYIIALDDNYSMAMVGAPNRKYLWILGRSVTLEAEVFEGILQRLEQQGYDPDRLIFSNPRHHSADSF